MAQAVLMPKAGISVESCIIGNWLKQPGDAVQVGDILFDYETDKASFECESTAAGTLLEQFYAPGDEVPVLTAVCAVGQPGEDVSALCPDGAPAEEPAPAPPQAASAAPAQPAATAAPGAPAAPANGAAEGMTPRARALAHALQVDPARATPTGPRGRVLARDVQALAAGGAAAQAAPAQPEALPAAPATASVGGERGWTDVPFTGIRKAIAASMFRSLSETAQLTHHHSFDASGLLALRARCKQGGEGYGLSGVSIGDMVLYAVSRTLRDHPDLNAHLLDNTLRRFEGVHLGVAVDTERGLMVPTIFDADRKSLAQISAELKELAAQCRGGAISPDLLQGASFTVSNLGALGVEMFTPVLNPPQVGILGVCGITTRVREGAAGIESYPAMGLSLTYDHRAVDGAPASRFARDLCRNLENFQLLLAL